MQIVVSRQHPWLLSIKQTNLQLELDLYSTLNYSTRM